MPIVIGGGLSGLSSAYYMAKRFVTPITVFEVSNKIGGWIRTENFENKGFIFEEGPRTIRPKGLAAANTLELLEELGMEKQVTPIFPTHPAAKNRMICVNNTLYTLPSSLTAMFRKIPPFSKPLILGFLNDLKTPSIKQSLDDESIYSFCERRFGKEIAEYGVSSMICGICAGDAKEISVRFLMDDLFEKEQKYGGVLKGWFLNKIYGKKKQENKYAKDAEKSYLAKKAKEEKWSIYSLDGGMESLPRALEASIKNDGVQVRINTEVRKVVFSDKKAMITINDQSDIETDFIISSIPAHKLAKIVENQHPSLAGQLKSIPYVDVAVVNLQYSNPNLLGYDAFGFLVPPVERSPLLGVIFDSCCFRMPGNTVLTVMMGGKWFQEYFGTNPNQRDVLDIALKNVEKILNIKSRPKLARVHILNKCIPQYTIGHKKRVEGIRNYIKKYNLPLAVCGAAYDGVGVNDVILSAKTEVLSIIDAFKEL